MAPQPQCALASSVRFHVHIQ